MIPRNSRISSDAYLVVRKKFPSEGPLGKCASSSRMKISSASCKCQLTADPAPSEKTDTQGATERERERERDSENQRETGRTWNVSERQVVTEQLSNAVVGERNVPRESLPASGNVVTFQTNQLALSALLASHQGEPGSIPGRFTLNFCKWESCRTMLMVGGFPRGSPVSPAPSFMRCSFLTSLHPLRLSKPRC
ncbi:hypothetical protein PR048_014128 [Dryococelus australis]|uniref:Uncharacterized protein n=1 Tax=Dryococelus australis TaxID=614101 RepID=A0ABQ9HDG2_9NEOP|nr:hypothetical protein PR048_014128 [Dryococelus australis]